MKEKKEVKKDDMKKKTFILEDYQPEVLYFFQQYPVCIKVEQKKIKDENPILLLVMKAFYDHIVNFPIAEQKRKVAKFLGRLSSILLNEKGKNPSELIMMRLKDILNRDIRHKEVSTTFLYTLHEILYNDLKDYGEKKLIKILGSSLKYRILLIEPTFLPTSASKNILSKLQLSIKCLVNDERPFNICLFLGSTSYLLYTRNQCKDYFQLSNISEESFSVHNIEMPEFRETYENFYTKEFVNWFCSKEITEEFNNAFKTKFYQAADKPLKELYKGLKRTNEILYFELSNLADHYEKQADLDKSNPDYEEKKRSIDGCLSRIKNALKEYKGEIEDGEKAGEVKEQGKLEKLKPEGFKSQLKYLGDASQLTSSPIRVTKETSSTKPTKSTE